MASVRMTQRLASEIRSAAYAAYETANPDPVPSTEFVEKVRNAIIDSPEQRFLNEMVEEGIKRGLGNDQRKGANILPSKPKEAPTAVELRDYHGRNDARRDYGEIRVKFTTPLNSYKVTSDTSYGWGTPVVVVQDLADDAKTEIIPMMQAFIEKLAEHREKSRAYRHSIDQLLNQVTTVKQLLEVWPGAESLIPNEAMQKMHVKVTRKQRVKEIQDNISFDPTVANQAVLTSKMLGG